MKILEYGHIKPREVKCNHCGAVLEYTDLDLEYLSHRDEYAVQCPVCGKLILRDNNYHKIVKLDEWANKIV